MRRTTLACFALAVAGGCDPGEFNAAFDKAPVRFIGAPGGFGSNVGRTLLPLAPPTDRPKVAARLLFAGTDQPSLAVADFDGNGKPRVQTATSAELGTLGLAAGQGGISSAARLSAPPAAGSAELEMIVLGTPGTPEPGPAGGVAFLSLVTDSGGKLGFQTARVFGPGPAGHFGLAVASGHVTQADADEAVVVSDNDVHVLRFPVGDVVSAATCAVSLPPPPDLYRSLAVGNFLSAGNQQIAVGLPVKGGTGRVVILQYRLNPSSGAEELFCARELKVPDPVGNLAVGEFGTALVAVPLANGMADLVVGAPPYRTYRFYFDGKQPTLFTNDDPSVDFGRRVALVDIDGDGSKELAITALQADVGSTKKAGQVLIYKLGADRMPPIAIVNDSTPTANTEFFGIGLADLEFNSIGACAKGQGQDVHVLVAGADTGIFTFFNFPGSQADPRCFAAK